MNTYDLEHVCTIMKRVLAQADRASDTDEAVPREDESLPDFIQAFADKIPQTHGAPVRKAAAVD